MQFLPFLRHKKVIVLVLLTSFSAFVFLSWWLVFRDERALAGIGTFYPSLSHPLLAAREWLLSYGLNLIPTILFALVSVVAFATYFVSLKLNFSKKSSLLLALLFQLLAFLSYPILSTDIFSYIASDRVLVEYGQNPWLVSPDTFPDDPFVKLADWKDQPRVYGAVNQIIYLPATVFGGGALLPTVFWYKITAAVFVLGILAAVLVLVQEEKENKQALILRTIFWNPLLVLELTGNGHNDSAMIFFLLLSLVSWRKQKWLLAGIFLAFSVQVKLIPVLVFGFFILELLKKKSWRPMVNFGLGFALVNMLAFAAMKISPTLFLDRVFYNTAVYWQSLPTLAVRFFPAMTVPFTAIFALLCLGLAAGQIKNNWSELKTATLALALYVSLFSAAYWNWYVLWPLVLSVFMTKNLQLKNYLLLLSCTSLLAYPLLWLSHRFGFGHPLWPIVTYLFIFGLPMLLNILLAHTPLLGNNSRVYYGTWFANKPRWWNR